MRGLASGLAILGLCVALAVLYGLVHDQITVRVSLEYFTIGHPHLVDSEDPTVLALAWGVAATWWVGVLLGLLLWPAMRLGRRPTLTWRDLVRPAFVLLAVMAVLALLAGLAGWLLASSGSVRLVGSLAERIPTGRHVAFLAAWWAHLASYAAGALGGIVLAVRLWRRRGRLARGLSGATLTALVALALLPGCLQSEGALELEADGRGRWVQTVTLDPAARGDLLAAFAALGGGDAPATRAPTADPFAVAWIESRARGVRGVTLDKVERRVGATRADGSRAPDATRVEAHFAQLESAARADLLFPATVELERVEEGVWCLRLVAPWHAAATAEDGELAGRPYADAVAALAPALAAYRTELTLRLPGPIRSTTGEQATGGTSVRWVWSLETLRARKGTLLEIVFDAPDAGGLRPFRHRPEAAALLERALEAPPCARGSADE